MKILDILSSENLIAPSLGGTTKTAVLRELAEHLAAQHPGQRIDAGKLVDVLWERERLGSTAIGDGIAIPHGKLPGLQGVIGAFGRHVQGVDFDSLDGSPTQLFFLLVAPEDSVGQHLKALARVSRLLKDRAFRDQLIGAADRAEIFRLIREEDEKL
jgi:PTS system nitrogen regulatory IIA component